VAEDTTPAFLTRALAGDDATADATETRILDAALHEFAARGIRAVTVDDIAARAGMGRVTVFRRFGSKERLADLVYARELRRFLGSISDRFETVEDPGERVVEAFLLCVREARENPLVTRPAREEPGAMLERISRGDPSSMELGRRFVASYLQGSRDADEIADVLVRLAVSYMLVPSAVVDLSDEARAREFARAVLAPIVTGPKSPRSISERRQRR
jgi:TetR/AcrR family transcriptional regulator, repressor for uid operon